MTLLHRPKSALRRRHHGVDFGLTVAGLWAGENTGRVLERIMEYAPQPPYGTGRPDLADAQTLAAARAAMQQAMTGVAA